jgi:hypothetical protein
MDMDRDAGAWRVAHAPAANVQATATKAAAVGLRNVLRSVCFTLAAGAVAPAAVQLGVVVRDGASGAGVVLWAGVMSLEAVAGSSALPVALSGLWIEGSPNTAMTVEFSAAAGANTVEAVSATGVLSERS